MTPNSKYADGLPLYRQEEIYARDGVELDRSLMAQWMGRVGFELEPLAQYVLHTIRQGERIFADETRLPTLAPGSGKVKTAWLWAYARDDRLFGGRVHILQVDGYAAYTWLSKQRGANDAITLAGCWAHARRKFFDRHAADGSSFAAAVLKAMAPLWAIEGDIRGHDAALRARSGRNAPRRSSPACSPCSKRNSPPVGQDQSRRGHPLHPEPSRCLRTLTHRRGHRDRLQHC